VRPLLAVVLLSFCTVWDAAQQATGQYDLVKDFPIILEIQGSQVINPVADRPRELAEANAMGSAPPIFAVYRGFLSTSAPVPERESHWRLGCWVENPRYEQDICADMPIGLHRARWVDNRRLLEVVAYDATGNITLRYIDASIDPRNPPPPNDPIESLPVYAGLYSTNDQTRKDYPVLLHVYGAVSLSLPAGQLPARTSCDITDRYINNAIHVECTQFPPIPLSRGYIVIDAAIDGDRQRNISCDAKWRWTRCSVLGPGLYESRWTDGNHSKISVLVRRDGKPKEIGFEVR
jgi:hypothetical protein